MVDAGGGSGIGSGSCSDSISSPVIIPESSSSSSSSSLAKNICVNVATGSVWESRMKIKDSKVFNVDGGSTPTPLSITSHLAKSPKKTSAADPRGASIGKRKALKSQVVPEGKVQLASTSSSSSSTSPVQDTKGKRESRKPPVPIMRLRSDVIVSRSIKESTNSSQLRKSKSEFVRIKESRKEIGEKLPVEEKEEEEEEEGGIEGESDEKGVVDDTVVVNKSEFSEEEEEEEQEQEEEEEQEEEAEELGEEENESEEEKKVSEIKEIVVFESKRAENPENKQGQVDEEIDRVPAMTRTGLKSMPNSVSISNDKKEPNQMRIRCNVANPPPQSKHIPSDFHMRRSEVYRNYATSASRECCDSAEGHSKLQNLADLIMWRDVSKSTLVFGLGTFTILSSSYTKEVNISFISVVSYMGLVYLALIFLYRSLLCSGTVEDREEGKYVLGEEEAMWLLRILLPYLNEFLLKLKALFSGDPATTMKLAVLLFVLARCGTSITIWNLSKFGFFGVFVVPKLYSSYSSHITAYGVFGARRFRDAWDSCTHKKAVAGAIFTLIWNLCSAVARIWAVFMLYVAFRYYQRHMMKDMEWPATGEDDVKVEDRPSIVMATSKGKKASSQL